MTVLLDRIFADRSLAVEVIQALRGRLPGYESVPDDRLAAALLERVAQQGPAAGLDPTKILEVITGITALGDLSAAASIPVHENTLRHRLRRYTRLIGHELTDADTRVELRWALAALLVWDPTTGAR